MRELNDEAALAEFRQWMGSLAWFEERAVVGNVIEEVVLLGKSREHDLVVVGQGRLSSPMVAQLAVRPAEQPKLGPISEALASSGHGVTSSVLVVKQHESNAATRCSSSSSSMATLTTTSLPRT
jgi:hypothetical protein